MHKANEKLPQIDKSECRFHPFSFACVQHAFLPRSVRPVKVPPSLHPIKEGNAKRMEKDQTPPTPKKQLGLVYHTQYY